MAKFEASVQGNMRGIVARLHMDIMNNAMSMQLVDESHVRMDTVEVVTRVYDKYYARNSNRTSLTLVVAGNGTDVSVCAIGSGGGSGSFFNFSWGAESDMAEIVRRSMQRMGL